MAEGQRHHLHSETRGCNSDTATSAARFQHFKAPSGRRVVHLEFAAEELPNGLRWRDRCRTRKRDSRRSRCMRQIGSTLGVLICILCSVGAALCEEQPESVTVCQLKNDPPAYNHKLVELTAFVSHDFEDFTLFDPTCPSWPEVWLEYGGKAKSGTMYCCGVTADRNRPQQMVVENIPIPLIENDQFREFDKLVQPPFRSDRHGAIVHATVVGRFFAGKQLHYPKATFWGGYGHMGCCSLLTIQEIKSVSSQDRDDLDYGASADQPDIDKTGCGYRDLTPIQPASDLMHAQQEADIGQRDWDSMIPSELRLRL